MERCRRKHAARKDKSLAEAECKMFYKLWSRIESKFVNIQVNEKPEKIRTICLKREALKGGSEALKGGAEGTPLVLVHGMGGGVGLWVLNLEAMAKRRAIYAFDLLGFGRSSRPKFSSDASEAESQFVESIEEWRKAMDLDKFILLGHSLGGFLSTAYTLKHPERVHHLILADPWGFTELEEAEARQYPTWVRVVAKAANYMNPFAMLRAAGPLGLRAVKRFRSDLLYKFSSVATEEDVAAYIFFSNSQAPSGEAGFKSMNINLGWARNPMIKRIPEIPAEIPITMLNGSESWIDSSIAKDVKRIHQNTTVKVLDRAGHHLYADRAALFNDIVNRICDKADSGDPVHTLHEHVPDEPLQEHRLQEPRVASRYRKSPSTPNFSTASQFSKSDESLTRI